MHKRAILCVPKEVTVTCPVVPADPGLQKGGAVGKAALDKGHDLAITT